MNSKKQSKGKLNRRAFLKLGALAGAGSLLYRPLQRELIDDRWKFIQDRRWWHPPSTHTMVPIGPERSQGDFEGVNINRYLGQALRATKEDCFARTPENTFDVSLEIKKKQLYASGMPESESQALLAYAKEAVEFLYANLKGLDPVDIRWTPIDSAKKYGDDFHKRCFIAGQLGVNYEVEVTNKLNPNQRFSLHTPLLMQNPGGHMSCVYAPEDNSWNWWYQIISNGRTALMSPFSETIPLTTAKRLYEVKNDMAEFGPVTTPDETLAEGISHIWGKRFAKEKGVPDADWRLDTLLRDLSSKEVYRFVPHSVRWLQKNGIQAGFDLYMDHPKKYMQAILL